MSIALRNFNVDDIVFAKIRGYPSWPAIINKIHGQVATVIFYSKKKETNELNLRYLTPIAASTQIIQSHFNKNVTFTKDVREVQIILSELAKKSHRMAVASEALNSILHLCEINRTQSKTVKCKIEERRVRSKVLNEKVVKCKEDRPQSVSVAHNTRQQGIKNLTEPRSNVAASAPLLRKTRPKLLSERVVKSKEDRPQSHTKYNLRR